MARLFLLAALPFTLGQLPAVDAPVVIGGLSATLHEYLRRAEAHGFSGSVLVERAGRIVLHRGYGEANRALHTPVVTTTPFYIASVSKPITAVAVLALERRGRLRTSDSIGQHFPDVPTDKEGITIHHLLTHTAGLASAPDSAERLGRDDYVAAVLRAPLRFAPGSRFAYSNEGYSMLAAIIERASGTSFVDALERHVFRPADMRHTTHATRARASDAHVYRGALDQGDVSLSHRVANGWSEMGATGIVSTTGDLYRFERALRSGRLLDSARVRRMLTPAMENYGYGWSINRSTRGTTVVTHPGLILPEGWNAELRRFADEDITIVVASNAFRRQPLGEAVMRAVSRLILGGEVAMPPAVAAVESRALARLAGTYDLPGGAIEIAVDGARFSITPRGQRVVDLLLLGMWSDTSRFGVTNAATAALLGALRDGTLERVAERLGAQSLNEWRDELGATWRGLQERFGDFRRFEVLHTVPDEDDDALATTYASLSFARGTTVMRYTWRDGKLWGASDLGSLHGKAQEVELIPAAVPLVPQLDGAFATFDLTTGATRRMRFHGQDLFVLISDDSVAARRGRSSRLIERSLTSARSIIASAEKAPHRRQHFDHALLRLLSRREKLGWFIVRALKTPSPRVRSCSSRSPSYSHPGPTGR